MPIDFEISPLITPPPVTPPVADQQSPAQIPVNVSPPDMPRSSKKILKIFILIAVTLLTVTVAALWWGNGSFSEKDIVLTLEAPASVQSGDEVTYKITYTNNTKLALSNISLRLFYPEGTMVLSDGKPTTLESQGLSVEKLAPGETGTQEVKVFVMGDKGVIRTARLNMIFSAGSLRSSFQKEVTAASTISSLPVSVTIVAPPTTVSGQPLQYVVDVRNSAETSMSDLKLVITYPEGFVVQSSRPEPSSSGTWLIPSLNINEGKRYTITGTMSGNEQDTKTVTASVQRNLNGQYVDFATTEAFTVIGSPLLSVSIAPSAGDSYVAFPGDTLRYIVTYENNSRYTLLGMSLTVKLDGDMYDISRLQPGSGFYQDTTRSIIFDAAGVPDFGALPPGKRGKLEFVAPLKMGLSSGALGGSQSFFVKASARLSTRDVPTGVDSDEVFAIDSVTTKIGSQPTLTQGALYDAPYGSGPLPPVVGSETVATIRWQITNPGNDIRSGVVTATLPPGVVFKGSARASDGAAPGYDSRTKTITWNVGTIPYGTGSGAPRFEATFQVGVTPSSNQINQVLKLITGAALSGTDGFTQQQVQSSARDVTTNTIDGHAGEGTVK